MAKQSLYYVNPKLAFGSEQESFAGNDILHFLKCQSPLRFSLKSLPSSLHKQAPPPFLFLGHNNDAMYYSLCLKETQTSNIDH